MSRNRIGHGLLCALLVLPLAGVVLASDVTKEDATCDTVVETFTRPVTNSWDPEARAAEQAIQWKILQPVKVAVEPGVRVQLTRQDRIDIGETECVGCEVTQADPRRVRVGVAKPVSPAVRFEALDPALVTAKAVPFARGAVQAIDGGLVWNVVVESKQATALRIHFIDFDLPKGAQMFMLDEAGKAFGPYEGVGPHGDGEFWSSTVDGDRATVLLRYTGPIEAKRMAGMRLEIDEVSHIGPRFLLPNYGDAAGADKAFCSFNESCIQNANCPNSMPAAVNAARDGIAVIQFQSGGFFYICSGGLLENTAQDDRPLFLTANHCVSKGRDARTVEAFFNFETPCGGSCSLNAGVVTTNGASIVATNRTSDYTILELGEPAPNGTAFLGWSSAPVANANGTHLYRISHPSGAPQAYSEHDVDTSRPTCTSWPRGNWIYSSDVFGATEGGSSGSPVMNGSGQVVGQLSGACGFNPSVACDTASNATVDGALAAYFSSVSAILDPGGGDPPGGGCDNDGVCESGEDCTTCPNDCAGVTSGRPSNRFCCGDGTAQSAEGNGAICDNNY